MKKLNNQQKLKVLKETLHNLNIGIGNFTCNTLDNIMFNNFGLGYDTMLMFPEFKKYVLYVGEYINNTYKLPKSWFYERNYPDVHKHRQFRINVLQHWINYIEKTGRFNVGVRILHLKEEVKQLNK